MIYTMYIMYVMYIICTQCWTYQLFCNKLFHMHYCVKSSGILKAGSVWKHHSFFRTEMEKGEKVVWEKQWFIILDGSHKPEQDNQTDNLKISNWREIFLRYGPKHIKFFNLIGDNLFLSCLKNSLLFLMWELFLVSITHCWVTHMFSNPPAPKW